MLCINELRKNQKSKYFVFCSLTYVRAYTYEYKYKTAIFKLKNIVEHPPRVYDQHSTLDLTK